MNDDTLDRAHGTLLGLACGDALGRPVEFQSPKRIADDHGTLREMVGDGTHRQPAGTVTDDTDLALCVARSLVETGRFDPDDLGERFVAWLESRPFDVGLTTSDAINEIRDGTPPLEAGEVAWERLSEGGNAGNGSVMRCAPHALAFEAGGRLDRVSRASSATTHFDPRCQAGCAVLNRTIRGYLDGEADPLARALETTEMPGELRDALDPFPDESEEGVTLGNTGYVVSTLETSLHDALEAEDAESAIVTAVNRGGDTDTLGAVTGAVAGARFGARDLPDHWVDALRTADSEPLADDLRGLATDLLEGTFDSAV
jgi:ADP-ribosyl-[dinitrogen reductase] hydrolase